MKGAKTIDFTKNDYIEYKDYYEILIHSPKFGEFNVKTDIESFDDLIQYRWSISKCRDYNTNATGKFYVSTSKGYMDKSMLMHRHIMNHPKNMTVDHINGNTCDNRKSNLRICTNSQNRMNTLVQCNNNTSGVKGVYWDKSRDLWLVGVSVNHKQKTVGYYKTIEEATEARREAVEYYYGEYAGMR